MRALGPHEHPLPGYGGTAAGSWMTRASREPRQRYPGPASEYGPCGPYEWPVPSYGEDRRGNPDNARFAGNGVQLAAARTAALI
jgi:hypothetical protein